MYLIVCQSTVIVWVNLLESISTATLGCRVRKCSEAVQQRPSAQTHQRHDLVEPTIQNTRHHLVFPIIFVYLLVHLFIYLLSIHRVIYVYNCTYDIVFFSYRFIYKCTSSFMYMIMYVSCCLHISSKSNSFHAILHDLHDLHVCVVD